MKNKSIENDAITSRARLYLKDLINDENETNEIGTMSALVNEIYGNELKLEILRNQQLKLKFLQDENAKDAIFFSDSIQIMNESCTEQLNNLIKIRIKFADELKDTRAMMKELHELSNMKELDIKIRKFSELSDSLIKITSILNDGKLEKILAII